MNIKSKYPSQCIVNLIHSSLWLMISICIIPACSRHSLVGSTMTDYTIEHLSPYLLSTDDVRMACELGVSMGPYLLSFERVMSPPDKAAIATLVTSALCAEIRVWTHELAAIRAFKRKQINENKDAMIAQKRAHADAARRYQHAYLRMERLYGEKCVEDADENTQLAMVLGFIAGIQAVQHDRASQVAVGVPTDIPSKISRQSTCLKNKKWWGVPKALQAAVWLVLPTTAPKGSSTDIRKKAYAVLEKQMLIGHKAGVRLADSIYAYAAQAMGDTATVKKIITAHAASFNKKKSNKKWRLLDLTAHMQIQALSDKLWTEAKGHRTPHGELGTFWEDEEKTSSEDQAEDDDLLDDLDDE